MNTNTRLQHILTITQYVDDREKMPHVLRVMRRDSYGSRFVDHHAFPSIEESDGFKEKLVNA